MKANYFAVQLRYSACYAYQAAQANLNFRKS